MQYIDLSHTITEKTLTYPGLPQPIICDFLSREASKQDYDGGESFQIGKIEMVGNTGTYIDCPFHRYANGEDTSQISLERFANLEGVVVRVPYTASLAVQVHHLSGVELHNKAVLIHTGWSRHWQTDTYYKNHPFVSEEAAIYLREQGAKLVGIDALNIDDTRTRYRPTHSTLLKAGILIVEHLTNLASLPSTGFLFNAVPPKIQGVGTFPVKAYAVV